MKRDDDIIAVLDIGTSKILALVARLDEQGQAQVLGIGQQRSHGMKKGMVTNVEATVGSVTRAIQEVEVMSHHKISEVYTGIAGNHIRSFSSHGMVAIKDQEVTPLDVQRVIETARTIPIPSDQQLLHTLTQEFTVDSQDGVREPIGMSGMRLQVKVHLITGAVSAAQNIIKCIRRCGLEVVDLVLQPLASSDAVLTEDEKELGVALVDIGGGTTDLAIFTKGAIRHTAVIPIAGDQITNDIAMVLRTPIQEAEDIKIQYGAALHSLASEDAMIEVPGVGDRAPRKLSRRALADVIEPRVSELFELVRQEINRSGYEALLSSGIVLTGGSSVLKGMLELGEEIFHMPVHLGVPRYEGPLAEVLRHPRFATAVGLMLEAQRQRQRGRSARRVRSMGQVLQSMKEWFIRNF